MKYPKTQRTRRRQRSAVLALTLGVALLAPWAAAREATVTTRDGREITGELKFQDDQTVILLIALSAPTGADEGTALDERGIKKRRNRLQVRVLRSIRGCSACICSRKGSFSSTSTLRVQRTSPIFSNSHATVRSRFLPISIPRYRGLPDSTRLSKCVVASSDSQDASSS